jgi:hypothetical protein
MIVESYISVVTEKYVCRLQAGRCDVETETGLTLRHNPCRHVTQWTTERKHEIRIYQTIGTYVRVNVEALRVIGIRR